MAASLGPVVLLDAGEPQLLVEPALAVAAAAQRLRLGERIGSIVDLAELGKARGEPIKVRFSRFAPSPFADLALEIGAELRPGRGVAADVAKREFLEPLGVERTRAAQGPWRCHYAVFVPHSPPIRKARAAEMRGRMRRTMKEVTGCSNATPL